MTTASRISETVMKVFFQYIVAQKSGKVCPCFVYFIFFSNLSQGCRNPKYFSRKQAKGKNIQFVPLLCCKVGKRTVVVVRCKHMLQDFPLSKKQTCSFQPNGKQWRRYMISAKKYSVLKYDLWLRKHCEEEVISLFCNLVCFFFLAKM